MSQLENVITTTFRARGGNVVSQLGSYAQGFGKLGTAINGNVQMSERLNNQWRAIGTTLRYAVAGGAIFGLTRLVGQLRDVNTQLGLMSAIGSGQGGIAYTSDQIDKLFNGLQDTAIKTILPLQQVNDAAINFLSTVQNVPSSEIPNILTSIGQAATLAQTPVEDLTQAVTTANIAFGRQNNLGNISQMSRMWYALITTAPGGISAAPSIAQSMPGLASMFQLAPGRGVGGKMGQAQMMTLVLGALRTGMPASTAMRGVTYLLQSLAQPTGGAKGALAGIGITPQFVASKGIFAAVMRLLTTITKTGNPQALGQIPDEQMDSIDESGGNLPGIPASEMARLRKMVPRIHGIRAAIILASQLAPHGDVSSLAQDLENFTKAQDNQATDAQNMAEAWKRFSNRAKLQQATVAINAMGIQVASMFNPILNYAAKNIVFGALGLQHHRTAAKVGIEGAGGFLAAMGAARFLGVGNLKLLRGIPGMGLLRGGTGSGFIAGRAIESAISGTQGLGATPENPMYVIVVGTIFGSPVSGSSVTNTGPTDPGAKGGFLGGLLKKVGGAAGGAWSLLGVGGATAVAAAAAIPVLYNELIKHMQGSSRPIPKGHPLLSRYANSGGLQNYVPNKAQASILDQFAGGQISADRAEQTLRAMQLIKGVTGVESFRQGMLNGRADVFLTLDMTDITGKKITKRVHIPVDLWSGGRKPSNRGKSGGTTRGH